MKCGTFMACTRCGTVNWRTDAYLRLCRKATIGCRNCNHNEFRFANRYPTLRERLYLIRWWVWEQNMANRPGLPGADPLWYLKPWNVWRVLIDGATIMDKYNIIQSEGDHEVPRNIARMRAELSGHSATGSAPVVHPPDVLVGSRAFPGDGAV